MGRYDRYAELAIEALMAWTLLGALVLVATLGLAGPRSPAVTVVMLVAFVPCLLAVTVGLVVALVLRVCDSWRTARHP